MFAFAVFLLLLAETTTGWSKPDTWRTHDRGGCIAREREALLSIKAGITADPGLLLSSWQGQDCCRWEGVRRSNITGGHVVELDLHARDDWSSSLEGEISSSLKARSICSIWTLVGTAISSDLEAASQTSWGLFVTLGTVRP
jgi:hypothetical protein